MSKPQTKSTTATTTQTRNASKATAGVTAKKSTSSSLSKTSTGATKTTSTQLKPATTATTATKRAAEDKDKLKNATQVRKAGAVPTTRSKIPNSVSKLQTHSETAKTTTTTRAKATTVTTAKTTTTGPTKATSISRQASITAGGHNSLTNAKQRVTTQSSVTSRAGQDRGQPMRAKRNADIVEAVKRNAATVGKKAATAAASKPNAVLDTFHSVTVASPPPRRKQSQAVEIEPQIVEPVIPEETPKRVRTRTLDDEEIVVLRSESAKRRIEQQILADEEAVVQRKEPVAFEVNFDTASKAANTKRRTSREASSTRAKTEAVATTAEDEQSNYSDDFESYESDFETGSSSQNGTATEAESDAASEAVSDDEEDTDESAAQQEHDSSSGEEEEDEEEESELTQYPVTVIQRDKELERKLDSGHYEMNSRKHPKISEVAAQTSQQQQQFDSMDTSYSVTTTSEQLDSGISSYGNGSGSGSGSGSGNGSATTQNEVDKFGGIVCAQGGYIHFNTRPVFSKRGVELMSKIQFDTLTFTLFELKPISYEIYMQTYGQHNTTQCATQTNENRMSSECQTEEYDVRTMWTQHPAQYDLQTVQKLSSGLSGGATAAQNCCGEATKDSDYTTPLSTSDGYDASLQSLAQFRRHNGGRVLNLQLKSLRKPIDFERLNAFLLNATLLMSKVLNSTHDDRQQERLVGHANHHNTHLQSISEGYFLLGTSLLNALRVVRIFANPKHDLIITVHESLPDAAVYRYDFSNLLMVWSTSECSKPIRLLSSWSEVCRAEICNECSDIIVCGLRDGSIAMWDLRETYSFCSKLDGYLTHFAATQSVVPQWSMGEDQSKRLDDLGAVVDVRSFRAPPKTLGLSTTLASYRTIQLTSLNDSGILAVWTLVETTTKHYDIGTPNAMNTPRQQRTRNSPANHNSRFEYSSPWARVKLIQSAICDLRDYLERGALKAQTQFEKTKSLFQKDIYSDEVLRELNGNQTELRQAQGQGLQGLRFTSIDTGCERIYVCTNRNFVLACSKSLKTERFRKININEGRFLFPTALRVLTNEDFLAVGLSNGSVMIVNCNQHKLGAQQPQRQLASASGSRRSNYPPDTPDVDPDTGKSCAIQNIILNERRLPEAHAGHAYWQDDELRPSTAACIALISNQKRPFELRVYDQQLLLSGSALRKDLVQSLELSSDGWRLFALANGDVRTYDFYLDREMESGAPSHSEKQKIVDLTVAKTAQMAQHLVVLNAEDDVEVHLLKQ